MKSKGGGRGDGGVAIMIETRQKTGVVEPGGMINLRKHPNPGEKFSF